MKKKKDSKELSFAVNAQLFAKVPEFYCPVKHNIFLGDDVQWKALIVQIPCLHPENNLDNCALSERFRVVHIVQNPRTIRRKSLLSKELSPLSRTIRNYHLTKNEYENLKTLLFPEINPRVNESFGSILKKILEKAGYTITIEPTESSLPNGNRN